MHIAVVGATGEVGRKLITLLEQFNISRLELFASEKSNGKEINFKNQKIKVKTLNKIELARHFDYVFFTAGGEISRQYAKIATEHKSIVIDNSSAFRQKPDVVLCVPEINGDLLKHYRGIVANPNCSTIQMVLTLQKLHAKFKLKKVIASTYQAVSGSGNKGVVALLNQRQGSDELSPYIRKIDMNVIPHIGTVKENYYTDEEEKMLFESRKILNINDLKVSATCVRVPVMHGHSISVYCEFENDINLAEAKVLLRTSPSVAYKAEEIITPVDIGESDLSYVCRLKLGCDNKSLSFWNVANNIRVGAATNAIRIMQKHIELNK